MPQRLASLLPQLIVNSIAAALLLLTTPAVLPGVELDPPQAMIALDESSVAVGLSPQLPLVVIFDDRMGEAVFAALPEPLAVHDAAQMKDYRAGDIAYLAAEQSLVVFLSDGTAVPETGLVLVGRMTHGLDDLVGCRRDCAVQLTADAETADAHTDSH